MCPLSGLRRRLSRGTFAVRLFLCCMCKDRIAAGTAQRSTPSPCRGLASPLSPPAPPLMLAVFAASICESYPYLVQTGLIDFLLPKKETMQIAKWYADAGSLHLSHLEPNCP